MKKLNIYFPNFLFLFFIISASLFIEFFFERLVNFRSEVLLLNIFIGPIIILYVLKKIRIINLIKIILLLFTFIFFLYDIIYNLNIISILTILIISNCFLFYQYKYNNKKINISYLVDLFFVIALFIVFFKKRNWKNNTKI